MSLAPFAALLALLCLSHCATGARIHKSGQEETGTSVHLFSRVHDEEPEEVTKCRGLITKGDISTCLCGSANNKGLSDADLLDACAELRAETKKLATNWECAVRVTQAGSHCVRIDNENGELAVDDEEAASADTSEPVAVTAFRAEAKKCTGTKAEKADCVCSLANGRGLEKSEVESRCKKLMMPMMFAAMPWQCTTLKTKGGVARCIKEYPFRRSPESKPVDVIEDGGTSPAVEERVQNDDHMKTNDDPMDDGLDELDLEEDLEMATDCEGSWQQWGECSKPCGGGESSRSYTVTTEAEGGTACPASPETQGCNDHACPVNCAGSFGDWEDCSVDCGGGSQTRSYVVTTEADHGGTACPAPESQSCNSDACPVNCAGSMGSWSACSANCGGGTQSRAYTITTHPAHGGDPCPASESQSCNGNPCPVNCVGSWGAWGTCSEQCGGGTQSRSFGVTTDSAHGGQACPASPESKDCNANPCPVHCEGSWGAWGGCTAGCGGGTQTRSYSTTTASAHGGAGCPTSPASRSCNTHACPVNCAFAWSGWGACSKPCGGGTQAKTTNVLTAAAHGGTACPASPISQSCNTHECPVDCKGRMGGWSSCSKGCGGGFKTQMYHVTVAPRAGGKACPIAGGKVACNAHACPVNCDYGYSGWSKCSKNCDGGTQSRSVNVRIAAAHGGRACPSGESRSCNTHQCACYGAATGFNADGGGNTVYFDRHNIACGNRKMSRWRLHRNGWHNQVRFSYTCCDTPVSNGACRWRSTHYNDDGDGESVYFDRHDLRCGHGEAMASWQLKRGSGGSGWGARRRTIKFDFRCCDVPQQGGCHSRSTHLNSDGGGNSVYMDRHDLACPRSEVMARWHLNRMGTHNRIRFDYTCCR